MKDLFAITLRIQILHFVLIDRLYDNVIEVFISSLHRRGSYLELALNPICRKRSSRFWKHTEIERNGRDYFPARRTTVAGTSPGEVAFSVIFPAFPVLFITTMARPFHALRRFPL